MTESDRPKRGPGRWIAAAAGGVLVGFAVIRLVGIVLVGLAFIGLAVVVAVNGGPLAVVAIPFFVVMTWMFIDDGADRRTWIGLGCLVAGLALCIAAVPG